MWTMCLLFTTDHNRLRGAFLSVASLVCYVFGRSVAKNLKRILSSRFSQLLYAFPCNSDGIELVGRGWHGKDGQGRRDLRN
jgi:hypothetical protein